jgi:hypothetical protein
MRCGRDQKEKNTGTCAGAYILGLSPESANDDNTPGRSSDFPAFRTAFPSAGERTVAVMVQENYFRSFPVNGMRMQDYSYGDSSGFTPDSHFNPGYYTGNQMREQT